MAQIVSQTVYTKTAKGILEIRNKAGRLSSELAQVFGAVDGKASVAELVPRLGLSAPQLQSALATLAGDGYIKAVTSSAAAAAGQASKNDGINPGAIQSAELSRLKMEAATHALAEAEATKQAQQEARTALDARLRAEAEARARALAELRAQAEAEARAKAEAAATVAADQRAQAEHEANVATDAAARTAADARVRTATAAAVRAEAEARARSEAEARARGLVEEKKAAEERAREESQQHARAEEQAQARAAAEARAREAIEAQVEAVSAVESQGETAISAHDESARAALHAREAEAEQARNEARAASTAAGVRQEEPVAELRFDDLAQRLTARVHAERRAREQEDRKTREAHLADPEHAGPGETAFPTLQLAGGSPPSPKPQPAAAATPAADVGSAVPALPEIALTNLAGAGDVKHTTPEHVPSALERAMMQTAARAEADGQAPPAPAAAPPAAARQAPNAETTRQASTGTIPRQQPQAPAAPLPAELAPAAPRASRPSAAIAPRAHGGPNVRTAKPGGDTAASAAETAAGKTVPELADEPTQERVNVDRAAHDFLAQDAEARRRAEAGALARTAVAARRQRQEDDARRAVSANRRTRRARATRAIGAAIMLVPALTVAWLQFVPMNGYVPAAQQALSERLRQPTTISTLRYVLLPSPRVVLEGVRIGSAQGIRIQRVEALAWPGAVLADAKVFDDVTARDVTIDPGMLVAIPSWTGGRSAGAVHVSRLKLLDVKLANARGDSKGLDGEVTFAANGTVERAQLASTNVTLDVVPEANGVKLALNARDWQPPFGVPITFSALALEGIAERQHFGTTSLSGRLGGGALTGTLAARWDNSMIVDGEFNLQGARVDGLLPPLGPSLKLRGILKASGRYAMQADSATGKLEKPVLDGSFVVTRGEITGIDLIRAVQSGGTALRGGRTAFDELRGVVQVSGGRYNYRQLHLTSGPLRANGFVEVVGEAGELNGRIDAEFDMRGAAARASFRLAGTAQDPRLGR